MAEQTLLTIVQNILSSLDADEVNSISDTTEARQVAQIVQNKYYDIVSRGYLPEHDQLFQLNPSLDVTRPTLMYIPDAVSQVRWVKYFDSNVLDGASTQSSQFGSYQHGLNVDLVSRSNWTTTSTSTATIGTGNQTFIVASSTLAVTVGQGVTVVDGSNTMTGTVISYSGTSMIINVTSTIGSGTFSSWTITGQGNSIAAPGYIYVTLLPIDQFLDMMNRFNPTDPDVFSYTFKEGGNNFTFYYKNDHRPTWCTVLANQFVIFDTFDLTQDDTLQASKTLCFGQIVPPFLLADSFVPSLNDQQFPLLLNESKVLAFLELRQMPHPKADQETRRQWNVVQKIKSISNKPTYFQQLPDFGRVPRTGGYSSGGYGAYKWMRQSGP